MVTGSVARAFASCAGLAVALVVACGGRSISHVEDDSEDGGTSGTTASHGGTGGTTTRGAAGSPVMSKGGTGGTTTGTGNGNNGGPSEAELEDACKQICTGVAESDCGLTYDTCAHHCYAYVGMSLHTVECARTLYTYFTCITDLPPSCNPYQEETCAREGAASIDCVAFYCRSNHADADCIEFGY